MGASPLITQLLGPQLSALSPPLSALILHPSALSPPPSALGTNPRGPAKTLSDERSRTDSQA